MIEIKPIELIVDSEIKLIRLRPQDAHIMFALIDRNREHLSQFGESTALKYPAEDVVYESIIDSANPFRLRFGIWTSQNFVGSINITPDNGSSKAETGYYLGKEFTGKGYTIRSLNRIVQYAFNDMQLLEVYARVNKENTASKKVLERAGFRQVEFKAGKETLYYHVDRIITAFRM